MKPDSLFKCIKPYSGKTAENKPVRLKEDHQYCCTAVDLKQMGHGKKGRVVFLHDWNDPAHTRMELTQDEFNRLVGEYLRQEMALA